MSLLGLIIVLLMGAEDWRTREFATSCYDMACKFELMPYNLDKFAFLNQDLEIQHRAEKVLRKYYILKDDKVVLDQREFCTNEAMYNPELTGFSKGYKAFIEDKEAKGWISQSYWSDGKSWHVIFRRK